MKYDFYHPNNIFVWDGKVLDGKQVKAFLETPYQRIDDKIVHKYSFEHWICKVLDISNHASF
ncbi:hypothetical protein [Moraxella caviae]|nr:hypothetical protein [Moraxella caviae]